MKHAVRFLIAAWFVLYLARPALSQSRNTGEIRGVVTDSSGAVLPNATVTVTNLDTGETYAFVSNGDGVYDTVSTPAGRYSITFSKEGFKKLERSPIVLQVAVITENATLEVGTVQEEVRVTAGGAPLLETETGDERAVLEDKAISQLPQIGAGITGNDWANFNILLPGASSAPSQPASEGNGAYNAGDAISINGNLPNYANYLQDGGVVQLPVSNNADNLVFSAVQEVQINTSSFSAQYGIGGAVFNQISKSGSNSFHGSAYEYWQNTVLNADPYFAESPGVAYPPAYLRYDEWGGSIGGPIIKNRLFFFFVRDKIYNNGGATPQVSSVPTLAEAAECTAGPGCPYPGAYDFSAPGLPTLYDPATTTSNPALCASYGVTLSATQTACRESFAQENTGALAGVNAIPASRVDPVALKVLPYFPRPNVPGIAGGLENNFTITNPAPNPNLRYFGRIDYQMLTSNRISFSISQKNNNGYDKANLPCPLNCNAGDIDGYNPQVTDTWTISPTVVNELRMGYTRQGNWFIPATIGFNPTTALGLQYSKANIFPTINITNSASSYCCVSLQPGTNAIYIENLYDPSDVITMIKGKHILHFGVEVLMGDGDTTPWGNVNSGTFGFTGQYSAQIGPTASTTGAGLADFLLGDVQNWGASNAIFTYSRIKSPQMFVQDDIKLRPNFTLNVGLRWVGTTGFSELNNGFGGFDPDIPLIYPISAQNPTGAYEGSLGSIWIAGQDNRTTLQKPIWDIFLPRVGFAWSPMQNTVVRGGYGRYSYNFSEDTYGQEAGLAVVGNFSGSTSDGSASSDTGPPFVLSSPASVATNTVLHYVAASRVPYAYLNTSTPSGFAGATYVPYNVQPGHINEYTLSVEHEFGGNFMAALAYAGSHAFDLQFPTDINQITNPTLLAEDAAQSAVLQANRPYPAWGSLGGNMYDGISNYNAMQVSLTKRYSSGLTFQFNYVWSHFLDDQDSSGWGSRGGTQDWQIGNDPGANYGNSNFDVRNAFKGYAVYELPFGTGKEFLNHGTVMDEIVGGWQVSGSIVAQSGAPFTINTNTNTTYSGGAGMQEYPNVTGTITGPRTLAEWFNTAAFSQPAAGTFGDSGRNSLVGPSLTVVNLALAKSVRFTERFHLQLMASFVNALNHPSFANPGSTFEGSNFGEINSAVGGGYGSGVNVGPRQGQLGALLSF
jgi:Carboxypeptidase regulatory-like domain